MQHVSSRPNNHLASSPPPHLFLFRVVKVLVELVDLELSANVGTSAADHQAPPVPPPVLLLTFSTSQHP